MTPVPAPLRALCGDSGLPAQFPCERQMLLQKYRCTCEKNRFTAVKLKITITKLKTHNFDARAPRHVADRASHKYAAYSTSKNNVTMYLGSKYQTVPSRRSTQRKPSVVPMTMLTSPTITLLWLIRSNNSKGGSRQTTAPMCLLRSSHCSARNIRLRTKESPNAA